MSSEHTLRPPPPPQDLADVFLSGWPGKLRLEWVDRSGAHSVDISRAVVLGTSPHAGVVIREPTVSRLHAEIDVDERGPVVRDLGSTNGTFVDRVEVKSARLEFGQTLRLGQLRLSVLPPVQEAERSTAPPLWPEFRFGALLARSAVMREMFAMLARVARTDAPVLIRGETGTGKELVARAIHDASPRASGPYVIVDCAALAAGLLESELFGHARGAFTGADASREGAIEAADGGTVFLDEIGELPLEMQPKLLRVLEQRTIRRLGESTHRPVDVRFIFATHRDLVAHVARGWFREDLYFRMAVLPIRVPPMRERLEDLELLVEHFLGPGAPMLPSAFLDELRARPWKGNVRELRNTLDRARALGLHQAFADSERVAVQAESAAPHDDRASLGGASPTGGGDLATLRAALSPDLLEMQHRLFRDRWSELGEKVYLAHKLAQHDGNISRLARDVGLARTYVHKLMKKYGL